MNPTLSSLHLFEMEVSSHVAKFMDSAGSISKYDNDDDLPCHQQVLGLQPHRAHPKAEQSKENIQFAYQ